MRRGAWRPQANAFQKAKKNVEKIIQYKHTHYRPQSVISKFLNRKNCSQYLVNRKIII